MSAADRARHGEGAREAADDEDRARLWPRSVFLLVAFLAIVVAGVITVLLPELAGDEDDDDRAQPAAAPATDD